MKASKKDYLKISNFFVKTNLEITLLKRDIDKLPDSVQKYLHNQRYEKINKIVSAIEMEFNMLKYISYNVDSKVKMDIDFTKYSFTNFKTKEK